MSYQYKVETLGASSWDNLERLAEQLQELLDETAKRNERQGWELWQVNTLNDKQGNNGFILIFRRPQP